MKTNRIFLSFLATAALGAMLFLVSGPVRMPSVTAAERTSSAPSQVPPGPSPVRNQPFASVIKVAPFAYCYLTHQGPYTDIQQVIQAMVSETQAQNIHPTGPLMALFYNSPDQVPPDELLWEVGFPVMDQAMPEAPLNKKVWEYKTVARAFHVGPYERAGETIDRLMQWISEKGYAADGPVLERYLDMNPSTVSPDRS